MEDVRFNNIEILIAEDNYFNYILLNEMATRMGVKHCWAKNGIEAIEILSNNDNISLIFMDINMPILDGIATTRKIREMEINIPIIFQTAYDSIDNKKECSSAGGNDFLSKPLNITEFNKMLYKYLKNN